MADAAASLRLWAIDVDLAGHTLTIPPRPASAWLEAMLAADLTAIVPDMLHPDHDDVVDRLLDDGQVGYDDLVEASKDAVAEAAGRPWWVAYGLVRGAATSWPTVGGQLVLAGVDLGRVSIAAALDAVYAVITGRMSAQQRASFDASLQRPPPSEVRSGPGRRRGRRQALEQFAQFAGPPPAAPPPATATPSAP